MFANTFPDLRWLKEQAENRFFKPRSSGEMGSGWPTVILNVRASNIYRDNIPGPLSLFSNWTGTSRVLADGRAFEVPEECFMLTNELQRYTLEIDDAHADTFNIHFGEDWARNAISSVTKDHGWLTDHAGGGESSVAFHNKLYRKTESIANLLRLLRQHGKGDGLRRDEILLCLLNHLVAEEGLSKARANRLSATKASTRIEIVRRLYLATDYMYSSLEKQISLDDLAMASGLSKFHLLRAFGEAFGQTPFQFLTSLRIDKAKDLLRTTDLEVAEIGDMLGFDASSTFSRRFRSVAGVSPQRFRIEN